MVVDQREIVAGTDQRTIVQVPEGVSITQQRINFFYQPTNPRQLEKKPAAAERNALLRPRPPKENGKEAWSQAWSEIGPWSISAKVERTDASKDERQGEIMSGGTVLSR